MQHAEFILLLLCVAIFQINAVNEMQLKQNFRRMFCAGFFDNQFWNWISAFICDWVMATNHWPQMQLNECAWNFKWNHSKMSLNGWESLLFHFHFRFHFIAFIISQFNDNFGQKQNKRNKNKQNETKPKPNKIANNWDVEHAPLFWLSLFSRFLL